jgi:malate dehydrogenase
VSRLGVNILGAGDLGATLARRLAERELARRIGLVDADVGKARGKALDLAQSGPVERYDVSIEGFASLEAAPAADCWIVADPPELLGPGGANRAGDLARALAGPVGRATLLIAAAQDAPALVEAASQRLPSRDRVLGSAPLAFAAALRHRLAGELGVTTSSVQASPLGLPPANALLPFGTSLVGGVPLEQLSPVAARRALEALRGRSLGPVALAHAAVRVFAALFAARPSVLPGFVALQGEYGHRGVALAVPLRLCGGRVDGVVELALESVDRVAFDTAAERRRPSRS